MYLCLVSVNCQPHVVYPAATAEAAFGALGCAVRHALEMEDVLTLHVEVVVDQPHEWTPYRDADGRGAQELFDTWLAEQGEAVWLAWRMKTRSAVIGHEARA